MSLSKSGAIAKSPSAKAQAPAAGVGARSAAKPARTVKRRPRPLDAASVAAIYARLQAANPEPATELDHTNAFTLLVAVVLSAQMTDAGVNKATRGLFARADTPEKMVALGLEAVREAIRTVNFYPTKAKNVIALSERLIRDHGGGVPADRDALEALPGVGRKTANVVMNNAFGAETIGVDTHVFRVANRIPLAVGETPHAVELGLEAITPPAFRRHAHHWLILHGRYICKARKPDCPRCVIADLCSYPDKTPPAPAPIGV